MRANEIIINSSNLRDFYKYRWLLVLFLLLWGGSLIVFLFRLKWLLIIAFVAIYFSFRKAFAVEFRFKDDQLEVKKIFLGFCYRTIKIIYSKVFFFPDTGILKFQGINDALFISLENESLKIQKHKFIDFICTRKEADLLLNRLKSELQEKGTYTEIRNLMK